MSIKEIVNETFEMFDDEPTEFLLSVSIERVSNELNISNEDATEKVIEVLYNDSTF